MSLESSLAGNTGTTIAAGGSMDIGSLGAIGGALAPMSILGAAGSIGTDFANIYEANQQNTAASNAADKQINFETQMSDTAHQREVADLKAAGLNPILSAGGSGATTPSVGQAPVVAPQISMPDFMSYGISMKQLEQADQKIAIDKANSASGIAKNLTDADLNRVQTALQKTGLNSSQWKSDTTGWLRDAFKNIRDNVLKPNINSRGYSNTPEPSQPFEKTPDTSNRPSDMDYAPLP